MSRKCCQCNANVNDGQNSNLTCGHVFCVPCKRKEILPHLEGIFSGQKKIVHSRKNNLSFLGGNLITEPKCDTCDKIYVDSDIIFALSPQEYSAWRFRSAEKITYLKNKQKTRQIKCSNCSKMNPVTQKYMVEDTVFDEDRRSFLTSFKGNFLQIIFVINYFPERRQRVLITTLLQQR